MASAILTTLQDITASDPAFDSVADATLETFIALAVGQMSATQWGALYTQGAAFLAAHLYAALPGAAATGGASAGGAVTQRKARNWAVQFKQQSQAFDRSVVFSLGLQQIDFGAAQVEVLSDV